MAKFILHIFFSQIEVLGKHHVDNEKGAVIFVGNHCNQFLDAGMLTFVGGKGVNRRMKRLRLKKGIKRIMFLMTADLLWLLFSSYLEEVMEE